MKLVDPVVGPLYQWWDSDTRYATLGVDPIANCATICRLIPDSQKGCKGFALSFSDFGDQCTLLFPDLGDKTVPYEVPNEDTSVYSIEGCL